MDPFYNQQLLKVSSIDSILSPDNEEREQQQQYLHHHQQQHIHGHFMVSSGEIDVNRSLENILLDAPSNADADNNSSINSRNESMMNLHLFDDEGDSVVQNVNENEIIANTSTMSDLVAMESLECQHEGIIDGATNSNNNKNDPEDEFFSISNDLNFIEVNDPINSQISTKLDKGASLLQSIKPVSEAPSNVNFFQDKEPKPANKLVTTDSTKCLIKFFAENPLQPPANVIDVEGKDFFDQFTTAQLDLETDQQIDNSSDSGGNLKRTFASSIKKSDDDSKPCPVQKSFETSVVEKIDDNKVNMEMACQPAFQQPPHPLLQQQQPLQPLQPQQVAQNFHQYQEPQHLQPQHTGQLESQQSLQSQPQQLVQHPQQHLQFEQQTQHTKQQFEQLQQHFHQQQQQQLLLPEQQQKLISNTSQLSSVKPAEKINFPDLVSTNISTSGTKEQSITSASFPTPILTSSSTNSLTLSTATTINSPSQPSTLALTRTPTTASTTTTSTTATMPSTTTTTTTSSSSSSLLDRSYDAWLPVDSTVQILKTICNKGPKVVVPCPMDQLTMPGIVIEETLGDPIRDLILKHIGEHEASKRLVLKVDSVSQDVSGLQQLIKANSLRAAVDLTGQLLTACGQGARRANQISTNTPYSLQLWFVRLSLLARLNLYGPAECEWEPFGNLSNPDIFYEFYQSTFPNRKGSMVPFEMRILHAELPQHLGRCQQSLDRLYHMLSIVNKIQENLLSDKDEYGLPSWEITVSEREECKLIWRKREARLLYCISNCLLSMKDYLNCLATYRSLLTKDVEHKSDIHEAMGRVYLQLGDVERAEMNFSLIQPSHFRNEQQYLSAKILNRGFVDMSLGRYAEAYSSFKHLFEQDKNNLTALNNMCVCALYLGRLREALRQLELIIYTSPKTFLQEVVVLNLCTLYELESSRAIVKKQNLLRLIGQHRGTGFNVSCLKMA